MGNTIASCGHKLTRKQAVTLNPVHVRGMSRDGHRVVKYLLLCPKCHKHAIDNRCILISEAEQERWLSGIGGGNVW
jgi:hypothetical protein